MSEAVFRLAYDGDAIIDGEMDVADLAPALLGVAQLLKAAGRALDGDEAEIGVRVKATRKGSFEVLLNLVVNDGKVIWAWWKGSDVQAAATLLEVMGITGVSVTGGVIGVVRHLRGKRPRRVRTNADFVVFDIEGDEFEVPEPVARLALDPGVRAALEKVVAEPLQKDGIERISFGNPVDGPSIDKVEADFFRAIGAAETDEFTSRYTKPFSILTLSFKPGQKWRLNDGRSKPLVTVSDANFQARVDSGQESFAKGDILICEVIERAARTSSGFKAEYEIVKVIEHRKTEPPPGSLFDFSDA